MNFPLSDMDVKKQNNNLLEKDFPLAFGCVRFGTDFLNFCV